MSQNNKVEDYEINILIRRHEGNNHSFMGAVARICDIAKPQAFAYDLAGGPAASARVDEGYPANQTRFIVKITMKSGAALPAEEGRYKMTFHGSAWADRRPDCKYPTIWVNAEPATIKFERTGDLPKPKTDEAKPAEAKPLKTAKTETVTVDPDDGPLD